MADAGVISVKLTSCYLTIWGWCPIESILGTLMIAGAWIAAVIVFRLIKNALSAKK